MSELIFGAQHLTAGSGGIGQVGRLSVRTLQSRATVTALAVEDPATHEIGSVVVRAFGGRRIPFVLRNNFELLRGAHAIYDFAGTGRANLVPRSYTVWVHGNEFWNESFIRSDYIRVIRRADCVLLNSNFTANAMEMAIGPVPQACVCWLSTEDDDPPESCAVVDGPPIVLFVGRSDEYFAKGQDILIKVWPRVVAAVDDARLCFVGDGIRLEKLRGLARASSVAANIDILGFQSIQRLEQLWRRATALVLLGRLEGFGLVAVEAMRHSVPVLASTDDAVCEVNIDGVTGYNVGRNDEGAIVDRLVALLSDRDRARGLGAAGFQRWQTHFRLSVFRDRFLSAVEPWLRASIGRQREYEQQA